MSQVEVNGVELFCEAGGDGDPLVLVHGSWGDHETCLRPRRTPSREPGTSPTSATPRPTWSG